MARQKRRSAVEMRDEAKAKLETIIYKKKSEVLQQYDVLKHTKQRRKPIIEYGNEDTQLNTNSRYQIINLCREIERNTSAGKTLITQLKNNVIGTEGKLQLNIKEKENAKKVNQWFNSIYAKNCDSKADQHLNDILKNILASVIREGDVLLVFDDFLKNDGKLIIYEADQLVEVQENEWKNQKKWTEKITVNGKKQTVPLQQSQGVVYDRYGAVVAYIVTYKHGQQKQRLKDVTVLPINVCKFVKNTTRPNQLRGTGEFNAIISDLHDVHECQTAEILTAKLGATMAGVITKKDSADEEAVFRGGINPETLIDIDPATITGQTTTDNYEQLEILCGGNLEYLSTEEEFKPINFDRPNLDLQKFVTNVKNSAGAALGLAKCFSQLQTTASYTAFKGELSLSEITFKKWRKYIERYVCDWWGVKAIKWAIENNELNINLPEDWKYKISWTWPSPIIIDPVKDVKAKQQAIKDGYISYAELLGPDYKEKIDTASEGLKYARSKGLMLTADESKSGALIPINDND